MRIDYHRTLIADRVRNAAFFKALKAVIVPGKTVVADIGAGTGLLGLMASKFGAKRVYLFEVAEIAGVAERILKANRARNCELIPCHSTEFVDGLQVDVLVSETLGNYALEENIIDTLNDARRRFLKPGGTVIPNAITQFVAPVTDIGIDRELRVWERVEGKVDLSFAQTMSFNNVYVRTISARHLLDQGRSAVAWDTIDLKRDGKSARRGEARWVLAGDATIYGFAYWWSAALGDGIVLSTAPGAPRTHWEQLYFPLLKPIEAKGGETVFAEIKSRSSEAAGTHLAWASRHLDKSGKEIARQAHDLDKGYLP